MRVEIVEQKVETRELTNKETGELRVITNQQAYLHCDDRPYPLPFVLSLEEGHQGYEKGDYVFSSGSFNTDKYGKLGFAFNIGLEPVSSAKLSKVSA